MRCRPPYNSTRMRRASGSWDNWTADTERAGLKSARPFLHIGSSASSCIAASSQSTLFRNSLAAIPQTPLAPPLPNRPAALGSLGDPGVSDGLLLDGGRGVRPGGAGPAGAPPGRDLICRAMNCPGHQGLPFGSKRLYGAKRRPSLTGARPGGACPAGTLRAGFDLPGQVNCPGIKVLPLWVKTLARRKAPPRL